MRPPVFHGIELLTCTKCGAQGDRFKIQRNRCFDCELKKAAADKEKSDKITKRFLSKHGLRMHTKQI